MKILILMKVNKIYNDGYIKEKNKSLKKDAQIIFKDLKHLMFHLFLVDIQEKHV